MNDPKAKPQNQAKTDLVDTRGGAEDPVTSNEQPLSEGLIRPRIGPDHKPAEKAKARWPDS